MGVGVCLASRPCKRSFAKDVSVAICEFFVNAVADNFFHINFLSCGGPVVRPGGWLDGYYKFIFKRLYVLHFFFSVMLYGVFNGTTVCNVGIGCAIVNDSKLNVAPA
jgi:hypothetical protein